MYTEYKIRVKVKVEVGYHSMNGTWLQGQPLGLGLLGAAVLLARPATSTDLSDAGFVHWPKVFS